MAQECSNTTRKRYAVVTGANKGIGLEICKQLAYSHGITVVLTARNEKRGIEAVEKLNREFGDSAGSVVFHQLDVTDPPSIASFARFIESEFGKLDILVNNAGIGGSEVRDVEVLKASMSGRQTGASVDWSKLLVENYDLATTCIQTNYNGAKRMIEALLPLLQLSDSPRIVNVSSGMGKLKHIPDEGIKRVFNDVENLTEEKIDQLLDEFLKDFKEGSLEAKGWSRAMAAYIVSKVAMNAYTRILAKKYPNFRINCVCPGYVKTDINYNTGILTVEEGAQTLVMAALFPDDGPTGMFIVQKEVSSFVE